MLARMTEAGHFGVGRGQGRSGADAEEGNSEAVVIDAEGDVCGGD